MSNTEAVDLTIEARWVLPFGPAPRLLMGHAVALREGRIVALGPTAELDARFAPRERARRADHVLMPGLVNAHTSAGLTLLRGRALARSADAVADAGGERDWMTPELARASARLALAEMLRAGITSFASRDPYPQETARIASRLRMRAAVGLPVADHAARRVEGTPGPLALAEQLWDEYRTDPCISLYFAPEAVHTLEDATLARVRTIADELDARIAMPVHGSLAEIAACRALSGARPLERLHRLGLLRPGFAAVNANHLDAAELDLIERTGIAVVACPQATLRQGSGAAPLGELLLRHVPLGLGSGSPLAVFTADMLAEARAAAFLLAGSGRPAASVPPEAVLELATRGSARALGLHSHVGSIEPGKAADLIAVDLRLLGTQPAQAAAEALLFGATRAQVSDVWIGGRAALAGGRLLAFDEEELLASARSWDQRLPGGV